MAKSPQIGVDIKARLDERALRQSERAVYGATQRVGAKAADQFRETFAKQARLDPTKLASVGEFGQHGQKVGRAMGDGAATAVRKGDFQGAGRSAARDFELSFRRAAQPRANIDTSNMRGAGDDAAGSFASGFGSAAGLAKLAGRGGPIAGAIIAAVAAAAKVVQPMIADAMRIDASVAMSQAKGGISDSQMRDVRKAATAAWGGNWGASVEDNVSTAVTALQSGLGADQQTIESLTSVAEILGEEIPAAARSAGQLIRTGLAGNAQEAFDILVSGQQNGLNVSQDWLDTIDEYSTQFRALGLSGADAIGLLNQMVEGGARNTDVAADALKELAIRAQDGSKATTDAFATLGLNAGQMATAISSGGDKARTAFDQILDRIRSIKDPVLQMQAAVALLGTKAEDLGDAFKTIDLTTAADSIKAVDGAAQDAADTALRTSQNEWTQAARTIQAEFQKVKDFLNMGDWFSGIPKAFNDWMTPPPQLTPGAPGVPIWNGPGIAPPTAGGPLNPLDVFAGNGPRTPGAPAATPAAPAHTPWWPGAVRPPDVNPRFGSQYTSDTGSGGSSGQTGPVVPNTGNPMDLLQGHPVNSSTYGAAQSLIDAQNRVAQESAELNATMADNTATQESIVKAQNELQAAQSDELQAQLRFNEAMTQAATGMADGMKEMSSGFAEIGAGLDADLGFSKGLPGLADNLVRFLANLATAPLQGILSQIANGGRQGSGYSMPQSAAYSMQSMMPQGMPQLGAGLPKQNEQGMVPNATNLMKVLEARYPGLDINADTGRRDGYANEHGAGRALDIMTGNNTALGNDVNKFLLQNADAFGLNYNLWQQKQWNPDGSVSGMENRGSPTQNHMDHVHANVAPGPAAGFPTGPLSGVPGMPGGPLAGGMPQGLPGGPQQVSPNSFAASYAPTTPSTAPNPAWSPQGGGNVGSGLLGMAMGMASGAAGLAGNAFAPGSGAAASMAAEIGQKAIERTIAFGGQVAGTLVAGAQESLSWRDPDTGEDPLANSWLTRLSGALMGARPAGSISAGKSDQGSKVDPNAPQQNQQQQQNGQQPQGGPLVQIQGDYVQAVGRDGPEKTFNDLQYRSLQG